MPNNENNNDNNIELPSYNKDFVNNNNSNINSENHVSTPNLNMVNASVKQGNIGEVEVLDGSEEIVKPKPVAPSSQKPLIEIPKEYYEQKEREKEQKEKEAMEQEALKEEMAKIKWSLNSFNSFKCYCYLWFNL